LLAQEIRCQVEIVGLKCTKRRAILSWRELFGELNMFFSRQRISLGVRDLWHKGVLENVI